MVSILILSIRASKTAEMFPSGYLGTKLASPKFPFLDLLAPTKISKYIITQFPCQATWRASNIRKRDPSIASRQGWIIHCWRRPRSFRSMGPPLTRTTQLSITITIATSWTMSPGPDSWVKRSLKAVSCRGWTRAKDTQTPKSCTETSMITTNPKCESELICRCAHQPTTGFKRASRKWETAARNLFRLRERILPKTVFRQVSKLPPIQTARTTSIRSLNLK